MYANVPASGLSLPQFFANESILRTLWVWMAGATLYMRFTTLPSAGTGGRGRKQSLRLQVHAQIASGSRRRDLHTGRACTHLLKNWR